MEDNCSESASQQAIGTITGYWVGFLLNVVLITLSIILIGEGETLTETPMIVLPWVINGAMIAIAIAKYPRFLTGYVISLAAVVVAALVYMPSCMATCMVAIILGMEPDGVGFSNGLDFWFWPFFFVIYLCLWLVGGLIFSRRYYKKALEKEGATAPEGNG
jgi:hypothetical protein